QRLSGGQTDCFRESARTPRNGARVEILLRIGASLAAHNISADDVGSSCRKVHRDLSATAKRQRQANMIKIAFLVPDNRQEFGQWELSAPTFGPAPQALLDGFAQLADCEVHVIFCLKRPLSTPERLAANIYAHALIVPPL